MHHVGVGTFETTPDMRKRVQTVLDTGRVSYGPMSKELEFRFAKIHDSRFGVLSNSGTSSLQVALQALKELNGWDDGDEVITASCTFVATVNIILHNRMTPVLVDVEPDYYGIDPEKLEAAITPKTRAIIPVHLFGMPCDMMAIMDIANRHNLRVIEDSCECMFVRHNGKMAGSFGDIGCFSMYIAHLLTAGVGGLSITNDPQLAAKMRSQVNHGRDGIYISIDDDDDVEAAKMREIINRRFRFETVGHSYRVTELESALALGQLDGWREMIQKRQENAAFLTISMQDLERRGMVQLPKIRPDTEHAFMMYPIVAKGGGADKWALCHHLETCGIETREMLRLTDQPVYAELGLWNPEDYPVADHINKFGFYVGCHQGLNRADLSKIVGAVSDFFNGGYF